MEETNVFKQAVGLIGLYNEIFLFDKPIPLDFINERVKGYYILGEIEKRMQVTLKN